MILVASSSSSYSGTFSLMPVSYFILLSTVSLSHLKASNNPSPVLMLDPNTPRSIRSVGDVSIRDVIAQPILVAHSSEKFFSCFYETVVIGRVVDPYKCIAMLDERSLHPLVWLRPATTEINGLESDIAASIDFNLMGNHAYGNRYIFFIGNQMRAQES
uniref:Uncharacterized protein n=1 Tax=Fusarium oxysporum (strain Fo5176) TaxID=660025 RepID=A0A0D2Y030_FUSOF